MQQRAVVITVSDRAAAGAREDTSGPIAVAALREAGWHCEPAAIVSDGADSVRDAIQGALDVGARVVVTTGGTGVSPRDQTPDGTLPHIDRELPGVAEELRRIGRAHGASVLLSRALAGVTAGPPGAFVVNLPGSPGGVRDGMPLVVALARHVVDQLDGGDHA